jgi:hypothetical protein
MLPDLLSEIARNLDKAQLPYVIIGGQAVLLYGEPRLTRDIDITLGVSPSELPRLLEMVSQMGLKILVEDPLNFVEKTWVLPVLHVSSGFRVDFIFSCTEYEKLAIKRARQVILQGYPVNYATPEDVIIHKIFSGRPRDLEDVSTILLKQDVNVEEIRKWLKEFEKITDENYLKTFENLVKETRGVSRGNK